MVRWALCKLSWTSANLVWVSKWLWRSYESFKQATPKAMTSATMRKPVSWTAFPFSSLNTRHPLHGLELTITNSDGIASMLVELLGIDPWTVTEVW